MNTESQTIRDDMTDTSSNRGTDTGAPTAPDAPGLPPLDLVAARAELDPSRRLLFTPNTGMESDAAHAVPAPGAPTALAAAAAAGATEGTAPGRARAAHQGTHMDDLVQTILDRLNNHDARTTERIDALVAAQVASQSQIERLRRRRRTSQPHDNQEELQSPRTLVAERIEIRRRGPASIIVGSIDEHLPQNLPHGQNMQSAQNLPHGQNMQSAQNLPHGQNMQSAQNLPHGQNMQSAQNLPHGQNMQSAQNLTHSQNMQSAQNLPHGQNMQSAQNLPHGQDMQSAQNLLHGHIMQSAQNLPHGQNMQSAQNLPHGHNMQSAQNVQYGHNLPSAHHLQHGHHLQSGHNLSTWHNLRSGHNLLRNRTLDTGRLLHGRHIDDENRSRERELTRLNALIRDMSSKMHRATTAAPELEKVLEETQRSPFTERLSAIRVLHINKVKLVPYNGLTDPKIFLKSMCIAINRAHFSVEENDAGSCLIFMENLTGDALNWFSRIKANSIDSYRELTTVFLQHHSVFMIKEVTNADLWTMYQKESEPLRTFIERFKKIVSNIAITDDAEIGA
ncbi:uncharacterized protein LOC110230920, partial [Arabidopsis lyrata subsp. lyrata]|uniref:uncharacterized protein LOC110230920 n=1 Tax=Arabidopsis lyrata subsp. lyrata TaxID=81972 RepID=UPI000A29D5B9